MASLKEVCGSAGLKTILAVGELGGNAAVWAASQASLQAGSDWIKTSTGKETLNANLPHSYIMLRAIKAYHAATGIKVRLSFFSPLALSVYSSSTGGFQAGWRPQDRHSGAGVRGLGGSNAGR